MFTILYQRLLSLKRNTTMVIMMFIFPLIFTAVFGGMGGSGKITVPYTDLDGSEASQRLMESISSSGVYTLVEVTEEELINKIRDNSYEFGILIPSGYFESIRKSEDFYIDIIRSKETVNLMAFQSIVNSGHQKVSSDSMMIRTAVEVFSDSGREEQQLRARLYDLLDHQWRERVPLRVTSEVKSNNDNRSFDQMTHASLGFLIFFSMFTIVFTIAEILDDRELKVWDRLITSPLSKFKIYMGNVMYTFLLGFVKIMLLISISKYVFKVQWTGNLPVIMVVVSFFVLATTSLGIFLSGIVRTPQQLQSISPVVIVGTSMLGGCYWPLEIVTSKLLLNIAKLTPQYWALSALKDIAINGVGLDKILLPVAVLLLMSVMFFGLGIQMKESSH